MPETKDNPNPYLRNPHLEGDPFFWEGGPDGILLIHGFTATTAEVLPLARYLYGQGYTVAGPLLPGHNARPADINRYGWRDWAQTVEKAYREIASRCRRVAIGGESTGGLLALYLAQQHPEVAAILAYAPALKLTIRRRDVVQLYLLSPFLESVPKKPGPPTAADELWQGYPVNPLKGVLALLQLQHQVHPRLKTITQPILIVQGRLDETVHPDVPQLIYDGVRSTIKEMHWMAQSSHCVILDQEREHIFALTAQFLTRVLR